MIVEVLFSTLDGGGRPNFAPMGVVWGEEEIVVRPFRATHTFANLLANGYGVANVTDDALAFVEAALGDPLLPCFPAVRVPGVVFQGACYWRELEVTDVAGNDERAEIACRVVHRGWRRDFLGFSRARNALVELAILATRLHLSGVEPVLEALERYEAIVRKTGDEPERKALTLIQNYVERWKHGRPG
ncbi:MAG: DUF447 domain-containing protein [Chloroflexia bacterium]